VETLSQINKEGLVSMSEIGRWLLRTSGETHETRGKSKRPTDEKKVRETAS